MPHEDLDACLHATWELALRVASASEVAERERMRASRIALSLAPFLDDGAISSREAEIRALAMRAGATPSWLLLWMRRCGVEAPWVRHATERLPHDLLAREVPRDLLRAVVARWPTAVVWCALAAQTNDPAERIPVARIGGDRWAGVVEALRFALLEDVPPAVQLTLRRWWIEVNE